VDAIGVGGAARLPSPILLLDSLINRALAKREAKLIRDTGANNPAIGYNVWPRWPGTSST
jgi:hypothetical protein